MNADSKVMGKHLIYLPMQWVGEPGSPTWVPPQVFIVPFIHLHHMVGSVPLSVCPLCVHVDGWFMSPLCGGGVWFAVHPVPCVCLGCTECY